MSSSAPWSECYGVEDSKRESRAFTLMPTYPLSHVEGHNYSTASLSGFFQVMQNAQVPGPYEVRNIHMGTKYLGKGAQFEVFGLRHTLADVDVYSEVDKPYRIAESDARGYRRRLVVAVKRPTFALPAAAAVAPSFDASRRGRVGSGSTVSKISGEKLSSQQDPPFRSTSSISGRGFGTLRQLHNIQLEVFALCHPRLRCHPNIVKLIAWGYDMEPVVELTEEWTPRPIRPILIVEHANCTLSEHVRKSTTALADQHKEDFVPEQVMQHLLLDIVNGLEALHECNIIHGDIKPDNVLIFPQENAPYFVIAKLSDFGLSVNDLGSSGDLVYQLGTLGWMAPELDDGVELATDRLSKCDFFSLGLLIWSVATETARCPLAVNGSHSSSALDLAIRFFNGPEFQWGPGARNRLSLIAKRLLPRDPDLRSSDLGEIRMLLDLAEEEIFDKEGKWTLHRFIDNTSWDVMFQQRDHTLILAKFGAYPASYIHSFRHGERTVLYSWRDTLHHFPGIGILEYQSISSHYLNALVYFSSMRGSRATLSGIVGEEVSGSDLFSFCFDGRSNLHNRLLHTTDHSLRIKCSMATAVAAVRGYYPAQAICGRFVSGIKQHLPAAFLNEINSMEMSWQRNAVATGFLLGWDFQQNHPEDFEVAMGEFRQRGGYNAHYCYLQSSSTNAAQVEMYSAGGLLLDKGLSWLQDSPLHLAAALDVSDRLQELLDNGFAVNARDQRGETALLKAAMAGSHSAVKVLMSKSADPGIKSPHSGTIPLHWLFMFSRESIPEVASLLAPTNRPALLQERSNEKFPAFHFPFQWPADTPLSWAVFANNWAATDALFNLGAHLSSVKEFLPVPTVADSITGNTKTLECFRDWIYRSIIDYMHVSVKGCERFISQLSRSNMQAPQTDAAIRSREEYLYATPLISAIVRFGGLSDAKIETLLDEPEGGDKYINVPSERYGYPLQAASLMGRVNVVKMLLSRGADVDARGGLHKQNALFAAIDGQHKEVLEVLLQQNPEPVLNCTGGVCDFSPLSAAASQGNLAMVQMLLPQSLKANVDPTPALHEAVVHPLTPVDLVELLINAGADIQSQISPASGTPLNAAAFRGNFPVVQKLLEHGACPNTASSIPPLTPLHSATIVCDVKTIQVLLEHGANVNAFSEQGEHAYPLQSAAYYSRLPAVRLLLEYGADINAQGGTFGNALQAAAYVGDLDIVKLLLRKGADASAQGGKHGTALQVAEKMGHKGIVEVLQACCARGEERRATRGYSPYGKLVLP